MLYASVSHNLSRGIGTFWFPQFSLHNVAGLSSFHEHPPLVFGIQSLFFKLIGDSMYVERLYTFLTMCITAALINLFWKELYEKETGPKRLGWLPIIFWISVPVCFWSYSNNMHENTMGIFTLAAVWLIYKSFHAAKFSVALGMLAGIFIFLATLSKGLPGFFPLAVPFLYWVTLRKSTFSSTFLQTLLVTLVPVVLYAILFFIPESKESLSTYLFKRVLHRINEQPTVDTRAYILLRLFLELLPATLLVIITVLVAKAKRIQCEFAGRCRYSVFFILVGLSASAPLILTLVQKGFYFVPSLPFFAIGFAIFITPVVRDLTERIEAHRKKYNALSLLASLLFIGTITFALMQIGKTRTDKELLHDVYLIGQVVPKQTTVSIPREMWNDWSLQCYLMRYFNISVEPDNQRNYCILDTTPRRMKTDTYSDYKKVNLRTLKYALYQRE